MLFSLFTGSRFQKIRNERDCAPKVIPINELKAVFFFVHIYVRIRTYRIQIFKNRTYRIQNLQNRTYEKHENWSIL